MANRPDVDEVELDLFVRALKLRHGYDFGQYAKASLNRRVQGLVSSLECASIGELTARMLRDDSLLPRIIGGLSVPVSEMFRDPAVFRSLREDVLPVLASYPLINIWQAGCAFGQEVYSLAILLEEEGLYDRAQIYATDFSDVALARAQEGIFPARDARMYTENYMAAGGRHSLADYYFARYEFMKIDERLKRNVTFANHNLVCDGVFCEAHLILCRNVLIYFSNPLQDQVLALFRDSLARGGFLCLGTRENIQFAPTGTEFTPFNAHARIFRVNSV